MTELAAWSGDEPSGPFIDYTNNGRDIPLTGLLTRTAPGGGYDYGGLYPNRRGMTQTGVATSGGPSIAGLQTPQRTVMGWVRRTANGTDGWWAEQTDGSSGRWGPLFLGGNAQSRGRNAGGVQAATAAQPVAGAFYHLACTYDAADLRLYFNGVLQATTALAPPMLTDSTNWHLFDGLGPETVLSDVRLFDLALDAPTITAFAAMPVLPQDVQEKILRVGGYRHGVNLRRL